MSDKYYTPTIDEFYIGFEYERYEKPYYDYRKEFVGIKDQLGYTIEDYSPTDYIFMKSGWTKEIFDIKDNLPNIQWMVRNNILEPLCTETKVKYLDKEDIESLGFKYIVDSYDGYFTNNNVKIAWWYNKKGLEIYQDSGKEFGNKHLFCGKIKNKSELKRLLKQLKLDE